MTDDREREFYEWWDKCGKSAHPISYKWTALMAWRAAAARGEQDAKHIEALTELVKGLEELLACYRLGKRPFESTWKRLETARATIAALETP